MIYCLKKKKKKGVQVKSKITVALFVALILSACVSPRPAMKEFTLDTNTSVTPNAAKGCKEKTLKIAKLFTDPSLVAHDIRYRKGNLQEFRYSQSQWADSPANMIYKSEVALVRSLKLFKSVQVANSKTKNDLILETNVDDFRQYYDAKVTSSYARVAITFTLVNTQTHEVVKTKTFVSEKETPSLDAKGGVIALNAALSEVLQNAGKWLQEVCQ
jgi:ABC-type uncharacterized transport system auxiliary subunit